VVEPGLGGVVAVVEPDREDLPGIRRRCPELREDQRSTRRGEVDRGMLSLVAPDEGGTQVGLRVALRTASLAISRVLGR
jgi:hypothetical protein